MTHHFDRGALRFGQISLITVLAIGYVLASPWLVYLACFMLGSALLAPTVAPQLQLYKLLVRRLVLQTDIRDEDAAPHRFAQQMGFGVLIVAVGAFVIGFSTVGWVAALMVLALALINVTTGFCAGCFIHAQLARVRS